MTGPANRTVLAIMPHPDDCEILCAGTLVRLQEAGYAIFLATMTPGDKGSATETREVIASKRREEARRGAQLLSIVDYTCLEFADLEIEFSNPARRKVAGLLRAVNPSVVITTPPSDYMADHEITSHLVRDACFNAAVRNYETEPGDNLTPGIPYLYYTDSIGGHNLFGEPTRVHFVVDITAQIERKLEALACHSSQREWLRQQHGMDEYLESTRDWCATRGQQIGVAYGEAFCQHRGHPYPTNGPIETLLHAQPPRA